MNLMGYDAMVLGPADLALGLDVVRQRVSEAEFAVLSADAVVSTTGELVATPYTLRTFGDHKVALIGLSGRSKAPEIAVRDPLEAVQATVEEAAAQADVVILLSHAAASINQEIAVAVPEVDVIVSGGQIQLASPWWDEKTGTLFLHADEASPGHAGRMIGVAHLAFDVEGTLVAQTWQRLALGPEIADDPAMTQWAQEQTVQ